MAVSPQNAVAADMECRRSEAHRALRAGLDQKLLWSRSEVALEHLESAYRHATLPTPLPWPAPQVTAYRLAHLLLRSARGEAELRRVETLLTEANGGAQLLGILPGCIHLAVLHRLQQTCQAHDLAEKTTILRAALVEHLRKGRQESADARARQGQDLNLLELSTYFLGADYEPLMGLDVIRGNPYAGIDGEAWVVVGTGGVDANVQMPKHLALGEVAERERTGLADIAFVYDGAHSPVRVGGMPVKTPTQTPRLLAVLCRGNGLTGLARAFEGADAARKTVERTRARLAPPLKRDVTDIILIGDPYRFAPGLRVVGAMPRRSWAALPVQSSQPE